MIRTLISLPDDDKNWLDHYSKLQGQSLSETIRRAVLAFKKATRSSRTSLIFNDTAGLWKNRKTDALTYVKKVRNEWD